MTDSAPKPIDPFAELERAYREATDSVAEFAKRLGIGDPALPVQQVVDVFHRASDVARMAVDAAGRELPPEARQLLSELERTLRDVDRQGVQPTINAARVIAENLDALGALVAEPLGGIPEPLASLVALAVRLAREPVVVDLTLPPALRHARLAGLVVLDIVEHEGGVESHANLERLELAIVEAVIGACLRNQASAPATPVAVHASLRYDLLTVEVVDAAGDEALAGASGPAPDAGWDTGLVRAEMDVVSYRREPDRGVLTLERRLRPR